MLRQMRGFTRSWFSRALLLLLGIAMSITITQNRSQIMNMFSSIGGPRGVADVAGYDISPRQLTRELALALKTQRQRGQDITQAEAVQRGLHLRLLESIIARRAMQGYAERIGVRANITQVADAIRQIPSVQGGVNGGFDRETYVRFLSELGYSEPEFEAEIRGEITTSMVIQALTDGVRAPSSFGKAALAFQSETRTLSLAEAPASLAGAIPNPDQTQLQAFYEDNRTAFAVPEYRALTLVYARASDFVPRVTVSEAQLRAEFESRRASLTQPEKRSYVRLAATSEQQARDAAARLGRGEAPDAVAHALSMQMVRGDNQTREQIADHGVAAAVFAMPTGAPPRAVQALLTPWAVVKLETITPAVEPDFAHEREVLRQQIAQDDATEMLNQAVSQYDDARAGGASPAEAARAHGLVVVTVPAVDQHGLTAQGQPAEEFVDKPDLITLAFHTQEGEASDFTPSGDADVMISVDHITPATTRPLAQVRDQLTSFWLARERVRKLQELGGDVISDVAHGQSFAAAVRARHLIMRVTSRPIDRQTASQLPSRELPGEVFGATPGAVVAAMRTDGGALLVAQVESIHRADPAQAREFVEQARGQMQQGLTQSLQEAVTAEAVRSGHARRNEVLIRQTFTRAGDEEEQPAQ